MEKPIYFTICSKNYLAYALTLGRSLTEADSRARFVIFLADTDLTDEQRALVEFETVTAERLDLPTFADMTRRYSIMEFNTAIKPACFQHIFAEMGAEAAVYLDPDILVLAPLEGVEAPLAAGAEVVLTPHSTAPLDDGGDPDDLRLLRTGTYNLGFAAFRRTPDTERYLSWWKDRLAVDCRVALDEGVFVDQKWMDLAPSYLAGTHILRHPGYNTAYWNLPGRPVTREGERWLAAGQPLVFFHFSGVNPADGTVFSKHQSRYRADQIGALSDLLQEYLRRLNAHGHEYWKGVEYGYGLPREEARLAQFIHAAYQRAHPAPLADPGPARGLETLCNKRSAIVPQDSGGRITNLTYEIWAQRPDLRRAFDITTEAGRDGFNAWLLTSGVAEIGIPPRYLRHLGVAAPEGARGPGAVGMALHHVVARRGALRPVLDRLPQSWVAAGRRGVQALLRAAHPKAAPDAPPEPALAPAAEGPADTTPVAVYGYFRAESGVGEGARRSFAALRAVGYPAAARLITTRGEFPERLGVDAPYAEGPSGAAVHLLHVNADQVAAAEHWGGVEAFDPGHKRVGYWAWELERFPEAWADAFDRVDEIWVPSDFVRRSVQAATDKPVHVVPHPVPAPPAPDAARQAAARRRLALPEDRPLFLTAFDYGSFLSRKNPEAALEALERAAARDGELGLILKSHGGPRHNARRLTLLERIRGMAGVYVIDRAMDAEEMEDLYAACDGFLSLHRSEGFGLMLAEAMARGRPVIATDYSGSADFVDAEVGVPIPYALAEVEPGAYPHGEGARWAEPDIAAAADALVRLAGDAELRARLGAAGRQRMLETYSLERVGRTMAERLDAIIAERSMAAE